MTQFHHANAYDQTAIIRELNDRLRTTRVGGRVILSAGIANLPQFVQIALLEAIANFTAFDPANDPYGEHDWAIVSASGDLQALWKIDYYDLDLAAHSPDPADLDVTCRVMTTMLTGEY